MFWNKKESHMTKVWEKGRVRDEVILVGRGQILLTFVGHDKDSVLNEKWNPLEILIRMWHDLIYISFWAPCGNSPVKW